MYCVAGCQKIVVHCNSVQENYPKYEGPQYGGHLKSDRNFLNLPCNRMEGLGFGECSLEFTDNPTILPMKVVNK